jgi:hypothetical protein
MYFDNIRNKTGLHLAAAALLLTCGIAVAGGTTGQVPASISIYMGTNTPGALVLISPAQPSGLTGCTDTTGNYVFINFTSTVSPTGRDLYASVLAAMLAGQAVSFGTSGCDPTGYYPQVYGLNVL